MTLTAAATHTHSATLFVILAGVAWLAWYAFACWWWPYAACRRCKGQGRFKNKSGRAWRRCRTCSGSGERLRLGRHVYNLIRRYRLRLRATSKTRTR